MMRPCMVCAWCLFNLKWHRQAYESLCVRAPCPMEIIAAFVLWMLVMLVRGNGR